MKLSQHHHLLEMYKPGIGTEMIYPVDAGKPNDTSDRWAFSPGLVANPTPVDKALWAESGKDVAKYKVAFAKKYKDSFKKPFTQATMMVAPVQWQTGYNDAASNALAFSTRHQARRGQRNTGLNRGHQCLNPTPRRSS